jgi:type II secretory ATPase GspE/PulE/Tfp pilus assembly ATPase PilB-like protein
VQAVLAQRLVRVVCPQCTQPGELEDIELREIGLDRAAVSGGTHIVRTVGCPACDQSGFRGRLGIFEMMVLDDGLREMIFRGEPTVRLRDYAFHSGGMSTLLQDGARKVLAGKTTHQELLRVTAAS